MEGRGGREGGREGGRSEVDTCVLRTLYVSLHFVGIRVSVPGMALWGGGGGGVYFYWVGCRGWGGRGARGRGARAAKRAGTAAILGRREEGEGKAKQRRG